MFGPEGVDDLGAFISILFSYLLVLTASGSKSDSIRVIVGRRHLFRRRNNFPSAHYAHVRALWVT